MTVIAADGRLYLQENDEPKQEILAESPVDFYSTASTDELTFEPAEGDKAQTMVLHRRWKRHAREAATAIAHELSLEELCWRPIDMRWKDRNIPRTANGAAQSFVVDASLLICIAFATVIIHLITGTRYGFHRDELATLEDARHLAWGYIAYPPITPFFGRLSLVLFGTSLTGFRFFAAIAEAVAVVLTGLMARDLGGRRYAQLVAATARCLSA